MNCSGPGFECFVNSKFASPYNLPDKPFLGIASQNKQDVNKLLRSNIANQLSLRPEQFLDKPSRKQMCISYKTVGKLS